MPIHTFEPPSIDHSWRVVSVEYDVDRTYCEIVVIGVDEDDDPVRMHLSDVASAQSLIFALQCVLNMHDVGQIKGYDDEQPE